MTAWNPCSTPLLGEEDERGQRKTWTRRVFLSSQDQDLNRLLGGFIWPHWRMKAVLWDNNAHTFCRTRMRIVSIEDENLNNYSLNVVSSSSSIVRPKPTVPEKPKYIGDIMKAYLKHKPMPKPNKENHRQLISRVSHPSKPIFLYNRFSFNSRLLLPL